MKAYISTGLVAETLLAMVRIQSLKCTHLDKLSSGRITYGIRLADAISFAQKLGWLNVEKQEVSFTKKGEYILTQFDGRNVSGELWRKILQEYIYTWKPIWINRIPYGRREAYYFMSPDEKRCFEDAGLMETDPESEIVEWWDTIAEYVRSSRNLYLDKTGRVGERLTMKYEKMRTGKEPRWISFESNLAGYDIISCKDTDVPDEQLLIEVKCSEQLMSGATMIISRYEWETATTQHKNSTYCFYLWLVGEQRMFASVSVGDVEPHIPKEAGLGTWKSVEIPFNVFEKRFVPMEAII